MGDGKVYGKRAGLKPLQGYISRPFLAPYGNFCGAGETMGAKESGKEVAEGVMSACEERGATTQPMVTIDVSSFATQGAKQRRRRGTKREPKPPAEGSAELWGREQGRDTLVRNCSEPSGRMKTLLQLQSTSVPSGAHGRQGAPNGLLEMV